MITIDITNLVFVCIGLALCILGFVLVLALPYFAINNKKYLILIFSLLLAYLTFDLLEQLSFFPASSINPTLSKIFLFLDSFFSSLLMPVLSFYMLDTAGINKKKNKFLILIVILWISYATLLVITQFTDFIYYIDSNDIYHRGPYYFVLLVPAVLLMLSNLIALFVIRKKLNHKQVLSFSIYLLLPTIAMIIQSLTYGLLLIVIATSLATFLMLIFVLMDQIDMFVKQNKINATQKAKITILEMRPHFIYNTMTSIYYLIDKDKEKAREVLLNFSKYLRKNFSALVNENLVSFNQELEHTQTYLEIEKVRYENKLNVEYDCEEVDFKIPPLTVQPIVENSIKHGLDLEKDILNIKISTRKIDKGYELIIEDDGAGFDTSQISEEPSALNNIKERLTLICNGSIDIESKINEGTKVTITVH